MSIVSIIVTSLSIIVSIIVSVISILYANRQAKKAEISEQKMGELEKALTSNKYIKDKAFFLYNDGKEEDSLDVFKKYLSENNDKTEWHEIILYIFKNETKKIFSKILFFDNYSSFSYTLLFQAYIFSIEDLINLPEYPKIIRALLKEYKIKFDESLSIFEFFIALVDSRYQEAKEILKSIDKLHKISDIDLFYKKQFICFLNYFSGIDFKDYDN